MGATGENKDSMERIEIHREWSPLVIKQFLAKQKVVLCWGWLKCE